MNLTLGAWLAAGMAGLTAALDLRLRAAPSRFPIVVVVLAGAALGALSYGAFVVAGMAVSILTFSSSPDAGPALLCVLIGCAVFLVFRLLQSFFSSQFGLPEVTSAARSRRLEDLFDTPRHVPPESDAVARRGSSRVSARDGSRLPVPSPSIDAMLNAQLRLGGSRARHRRSFDDLLDAVPRGGGFTKWFGGVGLAALPVYYGLSCIVTGRGEMGTTLWSSEVHGLAAVALGLGWIGIGLFLHFHFFFGLHPALKQHSRKAKVVSAIVAGAGLTIAGAWPLFETVL